MYINPRVFNKTNKYVQNDLLMLVNKTSSLFFFFFFFFNSLFNIGPLKCDHLINYYIQKSFLISAPLWVRCPVLDHCMATLQHRFFVKAHDFITLHIHNLDSG